MSFLKNEVELMIFLNRNFLNFLKTGLDYNVKTYLVLFRKKVTSRKIKLFTNV
jgi:hypothetical protein